MDALEAMKEPGGPAERKLMEALREKAGERDWGPHAAMEFDEIGRYHRAN